MIGTHVGAKVHECSFLVMGQFSKALIHFRNLQYFLKILTLMEEGQA